MNNWNEVDVAAQPPRPATRQRLPATFVSARMAHPFDSCSPGAAHLRAAAGLPALRRELRSLSVFFLSCAVARGVLFCPNALVQEEPK
tara:strand:- start:1757 stop:2020 length:264 start_codon:yes stop_codon:yes gene_type:complete